MMHELFGKKFFALGERDKDKDIIGIAEDLPSSMMIAKDFAELVTKDGFHFFSQKEYAINNGFNMYQVRKAIELLEGLEIISTKRVGKPERVYVKVLEQSIIDEHEVFKQGQINYLLEEGKSNPDFLIGRYERGEVHYQEIIDFVTLILIPEQRVRKMEDNQLCQ